MHRLCTHAISLKNTYIHNEIVMIGLRTARFFTLLLTGDEARI